MHELPRGVVPPKAVEAEQSVLGAVLIDVRAFEVVAGLLDAADFYEPEHALIWSVIARLAVAGKAVDVITVHEAGKAHGLRLDYLNALAQAVPSAKHARGYAQLVREASVRRAVMRLALDLRDAAAQRGEEGEDLGALVDRAVTGLLALQQGQQRGEPQGLDVAIVSFLDQLSAQADGLNPGVETGLGGLDKITAGGGRPGELWVLGARPSMGKSAISMGIGLHVARTHGVLDLSMEDSMHMRMARAVANRGGINLADVRNPQRAVNPDAMWTGVTQGVEELRPLHLLLDDQGGLGLGDVRRKVQQAKQRSTAPLKLVMVDYLQLMDGDGANRNQQLGAVANGMKALAKQLGVWVLLLSQLSRKADERGYPIVSDLRDSGDIEGAADTILLLHRPIQANKKLGEEWRHYGFADVAKQKNGPTGHVHLHFDGALQRFRDWHGEVPGAGGMSGSGGSGRTGRGFGA